MFQNGALNYWDTFAVPHLDRAEHCWAGEHPRAGAHRGRARRPGEGVIAISAHLGSVAFVGQFLPRSATRRSACSSRSSRPRCTSSSPASGRLSGARLLPASTAALRELLLALRRNEVVGLVTDRDVTGSGPMHSVLRRADAVSGRRGGALAAHRRADHLDGRRSGGQTGASMC